MTKINSIFLSIVSATLLVACGGNGGGKTDPANEIKKANSIPQSLKFTSDLIVGKSFYTLSSKETECSYSNYTFKSSGKLLNFEEDIGYTYEILNDGYLKCNIKDDRDGSIFYEYAKIIANKGSDNLTVIYSYGDKKHFKIDTKEQWSTSEDEVCSKFNK